MRQETSRIFGLTSKGSFTLSPDNIGIPSSDPTIGAEIKGWLFDLRRGVNTDEIYPVSACFYVKDIGRYTLTGDRTGLIKDGDLQRLKPSVVIGGDNFGCGSAREQAAIVFYQLGTKLILAPSFDPTFRDNCLNNGLLTSTDVSLLDEILTTGKFSREKVLSEFGGIKREILKAGGLFAYNRDRLSGKKKPFEVRAGPRPMTIAEKIIAQHLSLDRVYVKPGDQVFTPTNWRFSYEVFTPLMVEMLRNSSLGDLAINDPDSVLFFADHFIMSSRREASELLEAQKLFGESKGIESVYAQEETGGICHQVMIEKHLLPGQLVVGTDSHTGTGGVLGALCLPIGATAMANALVTKDILVEVPKTIRVEFSGRLSEGCMAKDVMLYLLSRSRDQAGILGGVFEYDGQCLNDWSIDELIVLANMAKEAGAISAVIEPNDSIKEYLCQQRGLSYQEVEHLCVRSDPGADFSHIIKIDLSQIEPMVALPGSPSNSVPLTSLSKQIEIQKAYIGSCTGGKLTDLRVAAEAVKGRQVKEGVELVVQPSSMNVYRSAQQAGLLRIFQDAGAKVILPACGACIGEGPGRVEKGETGVYSSNRNFKGRTGGGEVYLANPRIVATSAIAGYISS